MATAGSWGGAGRSASIWYQGSYQQMGHSTGQFPRGTPKSKEAGSLRKVYKQIPAPTKA